MGVFERPYEVLPSHGAGPAPPPAEPTWVRSEDREIATWVHQPSGSPVGGLVIVGSVGREGVTGFRTLRRLALVAARRGLVSLRMTLGGQGDSGPVPAHAGLDSAWAADVEAVVAFTRELLPAELPVHRLGLRLGAAVVARVPARAGEQRVLWEPVSGRSFVREQQLLRRVSIHLPVTHGQDGRDGVELLGTAFSRPQADSLKALKLPPGAGPGETFDLTHGVRVRRESDPEVARKLYSVPSRFAEIPYAAVDELVAQLVALRPADPRPPRTADTRVVTRRPEVEGDSHNRFRPSVVVAGPNGRRIRESMVAVGPTRAPGILVEPQEGVPSRAVLFVPPASEPKDGPTGLWPAAARALAAHGVVSLRADRRGAGDLMDENRSSEPQPYTEQAVDEVVEQIEWLQGRTGLPVSGVGICSGSWLLLRAGARRPLDQILAFNNTAWARSARPYERLFERSLLTRILLVGVSVLPDESADPDETVGPSSSSLLSPPRSKREAVTRLKAARTLLRTAVPSSVRRLAGAIGRVQSPYTLLAAMPTGTQVHLYFGSADLAVFRALHGPSTVERLRRSGRRIDLRHSTSLDHSLLTYSARAWAQAEVERMLGHADRTTSSGPQRASGPDTYPDAMATDDGSWAADDVVSLFSTSGPSDAGEAAALATVREQAGGHVLDIGVGGGRTTGLLAGGAEEYVGLDLMPEMVALAASRFPGVDLRVADARDLSALPPRHFDLVMFSFNGIDAVDHADRARVLRQMERVLAQHGRIVFSSFSIDGVSFDERPWRIHGWRSRRPLRVIAHAVRHPGTWVSGVRWYRRTRLQSEDGPDWGRRPMRQHEFRFVVHFATLESTVALVRSIGLEVEAAFADDGTAVDPSAARTAADYVHFVCRHPGSDPSSGTP